MDAERQQREARLHEAGFEEPDAEAAEDQSGKATWRYLHGQANRPWLTNFDPRQLVDTGVAAGGDPRSAAGFVGMGPRTEPAQSGGAGLPGRDEPRL